MTTATISRPFYDFGDLHLKNQTSSRLNHMNNNAGNGGNASSLANVIGQSSMPALAAQFNSHHQNSVHNNGQQQQQNNKATINSLLNNNNNNNNNSNSGAQTMNTNLNALNPFSQLPGTNNNNNNNNGSSQQQQQQNLQAAMMQQRINAAAAAMMAQQQQHHKMLLHSALTRAVSHPQGGNVVVNTLVNTLMENLGHRKLERTQSEPLPQVNTSRYKTELCRPFEEAGECKYGEKCQFAHGMHELRNLQRHPKYKTELCRTFHSVGFCPYGPRCHFVHNAEEARNHNRAVHAAYVRAAAAAGQPMPMSPPMSMSTGSDRASPTGSLSLSPTNSMASFFPDPASPTSFSSSSQVFNFPQSPPQSPTTSQSMSPVATPPPQQMREQRDSSAGSGNGEQNGEARLPIFNQLSSTMDAFKHLAM